MAGDEEFVIPAKDVPRDPEGFVQAFAPDDADGIREFFAEFGFVVVRDVYTAQQCAETIDDIWAKIEDMTRGEAQRGDESTWDRNTWRYTGIPQEGMIGGSSLWTRRIILNRQTPALHRAFATVLGNEDLLVIRPQKATEVRGFSMERVELARLVRLAVELEIINRAIEVWDTTREAKLAANIALQEQAIEAGDLSAFHALDYDFHKLIYVLSGNPLAFEVMLECKQE